MDASVNKYHSNGGANRGQGVNFGPLNSAKEDTLTKGDPESAIKSNIKSDDETLLDQADLDKLAMDFPGKTPENPWIKEQTNKQFLTQIKVSHVICVLKDYEGARPYLA